MNLNPRESELATAFNKATIHTMNICDIHCTFYWNAGMISINGLHSPRYVTDTHSEYCDLKKILRLLLTRKLVQWAIQAGSDFVPFSLSVSLLLEVVYQGYIGNLWFSPETNKKLFDIARDGIIMHVRFKEEYLMVPVSCNVARMDMITMLGDTLRLGRFEYEEYVPYSVNQTSQDIYSIPSESEQLQLPSANGPIPVEDICVMFYTDDNYDVDYGIIKGIPTKASLYKIQQCDPTVLLMSRVLHKPIQWGTTDSTAPKWVPTDPYINMMCELVYQGYVDTKNRVFGALICLYLSEIADRGFSVHISPEVQLFFNIKKMEMTMTTSSNVLQLRRTKYLEVAGE